MQNTNINSTQQNSYQPQISPLSSNNTTTTQESKNDQKINGTVEHQLLCSTYTDAQPITKPALSERNPSVKKILALHMQKLPWDRYHPSSQVREILCDSILKDLIQPYGEFFIQHRPAMINTLFLIRTIQAQDQAQVEQASAYALKVLEALNKEIDVQQRAELPSETASTSPSRTDQSEKTTSAGLLLLKKIPFFLRNLSYLCDPLQSFYPQTRSWITSSFADNPFIYSTLLLHINSLINPGNLLNEFLGTNRQTIDEDAIASFLRQHIITTYDASLENLFLFQKTHWTIIEILEKEKKATIGKLLTWLDQTNTYKNEVLSLYKKVKAIFERLSIDIQKDKSLLPVQTALLLKCSSTKVMQTLRNLNFYIKQVEEVNLQIFQYMQEDMQKTQLIRQQSTLPQTDNSPTKKQLAELAQLEQEESKSTSKPQNKPSHAFRSHTLPTDPSQQLSHASRPQTFPTSLPQPPSSAPDTQQPPFVDSRTSFLSFFTTPLGSLSPSQSLIHFSAAQENYLREFVKNTWLKGLENDPKSTASCLAKISIVCHHNFCASQNFHQFIEVVRSGQFPLLSPILNTLLLNAHIQIEQTLSLLHFMQKNVEIQEHGLAVLCQLVQKPVDSFIKKIDGSIFWYRYPATYLRRKHGPKCPEGLLFMQKCYELTSELPSYSSKELNELIDFVCHLQVATQTLLYQLIDSKELLQSPLLSQFSQRITEIQEEIKTKKTAPAPIETALSRLSIRTTTRSPSSSETPSLSSSSWPKTPPLPPEKLSTPTTPSRPQTPAATSAHLLAPSLQQLQTCAQKYKNRFNEGTREYLQEFIRHLTGLNQTQCLIDLFPQPNMAALHLRRLLMVQSLIEQFYYIQLAVFEQQTTRTHDFSQLEKQLLETQRDTGYTRTPLPFLQDYNIGIALHYDTFEVTSDEAQSTMTDLRQLMQFCKQRAEFGEDFQLPGERITPTICREILQKHRANINRLAIEATVTLTDFLEKHIGKSSSSH